MKRVFGRIARTIRRRSFWLRRPGVSGAADTWSTEPVSRVFGFDRGQPIDRYYIEKFLEAHSADIRGRALEAGSADYLKKFGGGRVSDRQVLNVSSGDRHTTLVGNLETGEGLAVEPFDCVVLTQVFFCIYDLRAAAANTARLLKPGGVMLATVPGISQISRYDMDRWGDFWRFTSASAERLFAEAFGAGRIQVETYGNVAAAGAFLQGLAVRELSQAVLDARDADYQMLIGIRAQKPPAA